MAQKNDNNFLQKLKDIDLNEIFGSLNDIKIDDLKNIRIGEKSIDTALTDLISKIGENIQVISYKKYFFLIRAQQFFFLLGMFDSHSIMNQNQRLVIYRFR